MNIYRIWYQFLKKSYPNSKQKVDSLTNWTVEQILETLSLSHANSALSELKKDLDGLRGIRNSLLHGDIIDPTTGEAKRCIDISRKILELDA
jgi:hypothetical protein